MFFALSFLVLAALLYFPASRMVWVLSVRRAERKLARKLDPAEVDGQRRRARFIAFFVVIGFSLLFNLATLGRPG